MKNLMLKVYVCTSLGLVVSNFAYADRIKNKIKDKQPILTQYDACDGMAGNPPRQLSFLNLQKTLVFFPNLLDTKQTTPAFYDNAYFNLACGGTALSGNITIKQNTSKKLPTVYVRTCGDLSVQSEKDACLVIYQGNYHPIMKLGDGGKLIIKYHKIFFININGTVDVASIFTD